MAVGSWQLEVGGWRFVESVGSWQLAGTQLAVGSWQLAVGSRLAAGSWQLAAVGSWHTQCLCGAYTMFLVHTQCFFGAYAMYLRA